MKKKTLLKKATGIALVATTLWSANAFAQSEAESENQSPYLAEAKGGQAEWCAHQRESIVKLWQERKEWCAKNGDPQPQCQRFDEVKAAV